MLKDVTGSFQNGLLAMAGIMLAATLLAASLKLVMTREQGRGHCGPDSPSLRRHIALLDFAPTKNGRLACGRRSASASSYC